MVKSLGTSKSRYILDKCVSTWISPFVVFVCVLIVYGNTFDNGFAFDDYHSIIYNDLVRNWPKSLPSMLKHSRSLPAIINGINYSFFGTNPAGYHAVNTLVHASMCVLMLLFIKKTYHLAIYEDDKSARVLDGIALFVVVFFAVHPINTMAVTYIIQGRLAALVGLFCVGSMYCFAQYCECLKPRYAFVSYLLFLAATLTKENAVMLPFVILAYDGIIAGDSFVDAIRKRWKFHGLMFGTLAGFLLAFLLVVDPEYIGLFTGKVALPNSIDGVGPITPYNYLLTQFGVVLHYLRMIILPIGQTVEYYWPVVSSLSSPRAWTPLLMLSGMLGTSLYIFRTRCIALFGLVCFCLYLVPESTFVPLEDIIFEHRVYLPFLGILIIVMDLFLIGEEFLAKSASAWIKNIYKVAPVLLIILLIPYAASTIYRNKIWLNDLTLHEDAYKKSPKHPRVRANLMGSYVKYGKCSQALNFFETLPAAYNNDPIVLFNLAASYYCLGHYRDATNILHRIENVSGFGVAEEVKRMLERIEGKQF